MFWKRSDSSWRELRVETMPEMCEVNRRKRMFKASENLAQGTENQTGYLNQWSN